MWYNCYWCACWFSRKTMFLTNGMRYIYCWWMKLLSLFDLCCLKTWGVWISGMKEICICGMRLTVDVAIDDFNWYVVMLIFMMILIWDDVVNKDHVNMNWCYCWWLCEYEMRLLLLLITSLRWDDVYVENDIEMECWWCWKCIEMCMLCMFMGGALTLSDVPCVGN